MTKVPDSNRLLALLGLASTVLAVWGVLMWHNASETFDTATLLVIASTTGSAALLMLIFTRRWSIRALGVLCQMIADALLYGSAGLASLGWIHPLAEDPQRQNLVRAFFIVGSIGILFGILVYLWAKWRHPGPTLLEDYDVPETAR